MTVESDELMVLLAFGCGNADVRAIAVGKQKKGDRLFVIMGITEANAHTPWDRSSIRLWGST